MESTQFVLNTQVHVWAWSPFFLKLLLSHTNILFTERRSIVLSVCNREVLRNSSIYKGWQYSAVRYNQKRQLSKMKFRDCFARYNFKFLISQEFYFVEKEPDNALGEHWLFIASKRSILLLYESFER